MNRNHPRGLFIVGTDTDVGKTYVACLLARSLVQQGLRVGVYKPVASGCQQQGTETISADAVALWEAANQPRSLDDVCPQRFLAPLAPPAAAQAEGRTVDRILLRRGLDAWQAASDVVIVEGAGGWFSPVSEQDTVADLAREFGYPVVIVAANRLGTINHTLLTVAAVRDVAPIAGVVLNTLPGTNDLSQVTNLDGLRSFLRDVPIVNVESIELLLANVV